MTSDEGEKRGVPAKPVKQRSSPIAQLLHGTAPPHGEYLRAAAFAVRFHVLVLRGYVLRSST